MDRSRYEVREETGGGLRLQVECLPIANYALALSGVPFLRALVVHNETGRELPAIRIAGKISLAGRPESATWNREIAGVHLPGSVVRLDRAADFAAFMPLLADASEAAPGSLEIEASVPGHPESRVHLVTDLHVTAYNEFFNAPALRSALAVFVQPNTRTITTILQAASDLLKQHTGDGAMSGYQRDATHVRTVAAAIYGALASRGITYVNPPASFENTGQKVRTSEAVLTDRLGTCIDLSVLYAACLEAAGIHPVIILTDGHAFAGFRTDENFGAASTVSEANAVANLVEIGAIVPVELTGLNPGTAQTIRQASATASEFFGRRLDEFRTLVDIQRCRYERILPMPHYRSADDAGEALARIAADRPFVATGALDIQADEELEEVVQGVLAREDTAPARVRSWKRDLLDLSLRNPLLNLPNTSKVIQLVVPDGMIARLDDQVHTGKVIRLSPVDRIPAVEQARGIASALDLAPSDLIERFGRSRELFANLTTTQHDTRLKTLKREADTLEQETGSNYLYLTLGALVHPRKTGGEARAPLFLLPVRITGGIGQTGFTFKLDGQETAQPNLCLLQWLRTAHGCELPELENPAIDDSGIAIQAVLAGVRKRLVELGLPFRIEESCALAILRFSTFQVWKDLDEHWESLLTNPVVSHLVERPGETFIDPAGANSPAVDELTLRLPIAADGSQMAAIARAAAGQSFVLEGPPGTGKSQTITNLIAHLLALGKTVLFVAEKQAALEVVQRRLDAVGIGALALELHGSKQSMKVIRDQLRAALDLTATVDHDAVQRTDSRLRAAIARLDAHPDRIHGANSGGHSLWTAWDAVSTLGEGPEVTIAPRLLASTAGQKLDIEAATGAVQAFQDLAIRANHRAGHPWLLVGPGDSSLEPDILEPILHRLQSALSSTSSLSAPARALLDRLLPGRALDRALEVAEAMQEGRAPELRSLPLNAIDSWRTRVESLRGEVDAWWAEHRDLVERVKPQAFTWTDVGALREQSAALDGSWFFRESRRKSVTATVQTILKPGHSISGSEITELLTQLETAIADASRIRDDVDTLDGLRLPETWRVFNESSNRELADAQTLVEAMVAIETDSPGQLAALAQLDAAALPSLRGVASAWNAWTEALASTNDTIRAWAPPAGSAARSWLDAWAQDAPQWQRDLESTGSLQPQRMRTLVQNVQRLAERGLGRVAAELYSGEIPAGEALVAFRRGLSKASIRERWGSGGLESFDTNELDAAAESFIANAEEARSLQHQQLVSTILAHRPFDPGQLRGEVADLKRQLERKRGGLSFRELVQKYPATITRLTPCFLMSPGSVAHFLDATSIRFDVVIFDEASQIRVPQAIGAMGRGNSVIVVGDSRQMPPTRIMEVEVPTDSAATVHDEVAVEDLESILTESVESGLDQEWLSWHYRSHDERLIAFSNTTYYDSRLVSLPSPGGSAATGLSWRRIDGVFDRGRSRTNEAEADAIVDEITARLANPATQNDSIGVVCFNIQQRDRILNKLEASNDARILHALQLEPGSNLFVKNLENVQGDERDVILFSLAFSKDPKSGTLPLNFGPLNLSGGERRLNVAVTRARKRIVLFSSFDPVDIDLSRTGARGIHDLRRYLEFAAAESDQAADAHAGSGSPAGRLIGELATALRDRGYEVAPNLGLSSFRVDLAVRKPGSKRWQLAVMVDGPAWSSRPTVVDRDGAPHLLETIMHWPAVRRVWLPGWMRDREGILDSLVEELERLEIEPEPVQVAPVAPAKSSFDVATPATPVPATDPALPYAVTVFTPATVTAIAQNSVLENMAMAKPAIVRYAGEILDAEGPTSLSRLSLSVAKRFGMKRLGEQKRGDIEAIIREAYTTTEDSPAFTWPNGVDPLTWRGIQVVKESGDRPIADISPRELSNAACHSLREGKVLQREDLEREMLATLGYMRLTGSARSWLATGIQLAIDEGRITLEASGYRLPG